MTLTEYIFIGLVRPVEMFGKVTVFSLSKRIIISKEIALTHKKKNALYFQNSKILSLNSYFLFIFENLNLEKIKKTDYCLPILYTHY